VERELSLTIGGGAWYDGLCSEYGSALEGVWFERGEALSSAAVGFPFLCSLGSTPPVTTWRSLEGIPRGVRVRLDVSVGTGATRGGEKEDIEKLCRRKAGEETEDDLLGRRELDDEIWSGPVTPPPCCVSDSEP
jgi:hypothetical protein